MTPTLLLLAFAPGVQLHLHVEGEGLLRFARGTQAVYRADAVLQTATGVLTTPEGYPMLPQIHVPADGLGVQVQMDGTVTVSGKTAGRIVLASFGSAPMVKFGSYLTCYSRSTIGYPGEGLFGVIRSGGTGSGSGLTHKFSGEAAPAVKTASTGPDTTIEVADHTDIDKSHILLGDIATITGNKDEKAAIEGLDLGTTPGFGVPRGITRSYILARLRNEGIDTDRIVIECPTGANVLRKGQTADEIALVATAIDAARTKLAIDYDLRPTKTIGEFMIPVGKVTYEVKDTQAAGDGATVDVEVDVDGITAAHRSVTLVPTAPVPGIHIGDVIKVKVIKNGAVVEVAGKAKSAGRIGASITIETEGGVVLTGTVRSTSSAEVRL